MNDEGNVTAIKMIKSQIFNIEIIEYIASRGLSRCQNGLTSTARFQVRCLKSDKIELGGRAMYRGLDVE